VLPPFQKATPIMIDIQKQTDQLEALATESELLAYLACDQDTRDHNRRLAVELRETALRDRNREQARAA
jgi:hypothetical protein